MEVKFAEIIDRITDFMKTEAKTETIVGDEFKLGEYSCIPVIRVGMGFGTGGGENEALKSGQGHGEGVGAGAGIGIVPIGFLVSKGDKISFISTKVHTGLGAAFEKVPDLLSKYLESQRKEPVMA